MVGWSVNDIVVTTAIILVIGSGLITSLLLVPGKREAAKDTFFAMLSMTVVAGSVLFAFWGGAYTLVPLIILLAGRIGYEAATVLFDAHIGLKIGLGTAIIAVLSMLVPNASLALVGLWLLILARHIMVPETNGSPRQKLRALFLYPILPMAVLAAAALNPDLRPVVLIVYVLVELFDSCAYAAGKFLGRTQAFPVLSPRKTIEGLIGGAICLMVFASAVAAWAGLSIFGAALLALLAGILGVAGDLAASRLKRAGKVKDFPVVFKKQGGALDVFDSWIAAGAAISVLILVRDLL